MCAGYSLVLRLAQAVLAFVLLVAIVESVRADPLKSNVVQQSLEAEKQASNWFSRNFNMLKCCTRHEDKI
jgi:hypothetical protein